MATIRRVLPVSTSRCKSQFDPSGVTLIGLEGSSRLTVLPVPAVAADVDTLIYRGDCIAVGAFRCRPDHPLFEDSGPIRNHCFVFPRTAVEIQHADALPFQGDPAVITLYNPGQRYRRRVASQEGDHCDYYAVAPQVMHEMLRLYRSCGAGCRGRISSAVDLEPGIPLLATTSILSTTSGRERHRSIDG